LEYNIVPVNVVPISQELSQEYTKNIQLSRLAPTCDVKCQTNLLTVVT